jgi:NTP pyrophosphatase (non-canonical NTP hydrolase)
MKKTNSELGLEQRALDLCSEAGELAKEVLLSSHYGKSFRGANQRVSEELGDVLFSTLAMIVEIGAKAEEVLDLAMKKYERRLRKGGIGSHPEQRRSRRKA